MKLKRDFVTNSSSTSFVISSKIKIEELIKNSPLSDLINSIIKLKIASTEEGLKEISENYGLEEEDDDYIKMIEIINNGGSIIYMDIPNGGEVGNINYFLKKYDGKILIGDY